MNKNLIPGITLLMSAICLSCSQFGDFKPRKTGPDPVYQAMIQEQKNYTADVRKFSTEYEVMKYIDEKTKYMRESRITEAGGEANWRKHLAWLQVNGGKITSFMEGGGPVFDRKVFNPPYEQVPVPSSK